MNSINQIIVAPKRLSRKQLAKLTGERDSTLKFYSDEGLLPFEQAGAGLARRYDANQAWERLRVIRALQTKGLDITHIKERLAGNLSA